MCMVDMLIKPTVTDVPSTGRETLIRTLPRSKFRILLCQHLITLPSATRAYFFYLFPAFSKVCTDTSELVLYHELATALAEALNKVDPHMAISH